MWWLITHTLLRRRPVFSYHHHNTQENILHRFIPCGSYHLLLLSTKYVYQHHSPHQSVISYLQISGCAVTCRKNRPTIYSLPWINYKVFARRRLTFVKFLLLGMTVIDSVDGLFRFVVFFFLAAVAFVFFEQSHKIVASLRLFYDRGGTYGRNWILLRCC